MKKNLREIYLEAKNELDVAFRKLYKYGDVLYDKIDEVRTDVSYIGQNALATRDSIRDILKTVKKIEQNNSGESDDEVKFVTIDRAKRQDVSVTVGGKPIDFGNARSVTITIDR